jgi:hypothetical protein
LQTYFCFTFVRRLERNHSGARFMKREWIDSTLFIAKKSREDEN